MNLAFRHILIFLRHFFLAKWWCVNKMTETPRAYLPGIGDAAAGVAACFRGFGGEMKIQKILAGALAVMGTVVIAATPDVALAAGKKVGAKHASAKSAAAKHAVAGKRGNLAVAKAAAGRHVAAHASAHTTRGAHGGKHVVVAHGKAHKGGRYVITKAGKGQRMVVAGKGGRFAKVRHGRKIYVPTPHRDVMARVDPGATLAAADTGPAFDEAGPLVRSTAALVQDMNTGETLYEKNSHSVVPIASITKLMTAMVILDARLPMEEVVFANEEDLDVLKGTRSRISLGTGLSRDTAMLLMLMSSENRAASMLARSYPGGLGAFVAAMNRKATSLGLSAARFADPTGLSASNSASPRDLVKMVSAASRYPQIRQYSTTVSHDVDIDGRMQTFRNTNALVSSPDWDIAVSKTGYISESGRCLVMQANFHGKPVAIVLLDSFGRYTRVADAQRVRRWIEHVTAGTRPAVMPDA
jgi:serine-type D-Ala-D-Ala endopeptidase (penicillin-binding protein 7)